MRSIVHRIKNPTDMDILDHICSGYDVTSIANLGYAFEECAWYKYTNADVMYVYSDGTVVVFYI